MQREFQIKLKIVYFTFRTLGTMNHKNSLRRIINDVKEEKKVESKLFVQRSSWNDRKQKRVDCAPCNNEIVIHGRDSNYYGNWGLGQIIPQNEGATRPEVKESSTEKHGGYKYQGCTFT